MKILLFGSNGQVGWELQRSLAPLGSVKACDRHAVDLENPRAVRAVIHDYSPDVIVNAAAYTLWTRPNPNRTSGNYQCERRRTIGE